MFETTLTEKLQKIFELEKVTYDLPGESKEQECIFVQVENVKSQVRDGLYHAKVQGKVVVHAESSKLPFGYLSQRIAAHPDDTKDLFFFDLEENTRLYENIVSRGFSFVYFFNSQYDPAIGTITSVTTEVEST